MKTLTHPTHRNPILVGLLIALCLFAGTTLVQAQQIAARPLTPQEIKTYTLPEGTVPSGGLLTVGINEPVYLEVQVETGTIVSSVTWNVASRPLGGSTADLQDSPITADMPIYSPGDRAVLEVAGRKLFVPDLPGKYTITADVNTSGGLVQLEAIVAGAYYTGVGTIDGATPVYPQCALCHEENTISYMETGHSHAFNLAIDGITTDHFQERCISCHALGKGDGFENDNFFDVAESDGWTFPETLEPGNWDAMSADLKAKANVQCEHCHGAGSEHHGDVEAISVSMSSGDCGQCHDSEPYHAINAEWNLSRHSIATRYPTGENRGSCVRCHSGIGFVETQDGVAEVSTDYEAITCAACHDPHSAENHHQLRTLADVELENGHMVTEGGAGKLCMNCHKSRRNAVEYVQGNVSSHYGPHYGVQGDLFHGTNAIEYDGKVVGKPSGHLYALENSCASCHMNTGETEGAPANSGGGHSFRVVSENGTPDDDSDDIDMVGACVDCHGPIESFADFTADLNLDGHAEPIQEEIEHLMHALALKLPPYGDPEAHPNTDFEYSDAEKKALYNYMCAEEDHSHGMHNPTYISSILKASIEDLTDPFNAVLDGINIPAGGEWFYSTWLEFYAPVPNAPEWIYHYQHGMLYPVPVDNGVWFYEDRTGEWWFSSPSDYPALYNANQGWMYFAGMQKFNRAFWKYATAEWLVFE